MGERVFAKSAEALIGAAAGAVLSAPKPIPTGILVRNTALLFVPCCFVTQFWRYRRQYRNRWDDYKRDIAKDKCTHNGVRQAKKIAKYAGTTAKHGARLVGATMLNTLNEALNIPFRVVDTPRELISFVRGEQ